MATVHLVPATHHAELARRIAGLVETSLKADKQIRSSNLTVAKVAGFAAAAFSSLPEEVQARLGANESELVAVVYRAISSLGAPAKSEAIDLEMAQEVEPRKGQGLGEIVSQEEGRRAITELAIDIPLEEWAGPVAGSTELERDFHIGRTTLHAWQKNGSVIGLLKGTRKHVFPREQFIDGRPVKGIADVSRIVGEPRTAWLWLRTPNPTLAGKMPIALLKANKVTEVVNAASGYFAGL